MEEQKKARAPRKKKFYVGYIYNPKNKELFGHEIIEANGPPDMEELHNYLSGKMRTNNLVILSCVESK